MKRAGITAGLFGAMLLAIVLFAPIAQMVDYGGGNVQGYGADSPIDHGTIVKLTGENSDHVRIVGQEEMQNMFGVTVDPNQLSIRITNGEREHEVFVAVSGTYNVLVSTQAGEIEAGDYVTLSSINGVAMKASTEQETVVGRAASGFDGTGVVLGTTQLRDENGQDNQTVSLGVIPVTINIESNPMEDSTMINAPDFLLRAGQAIAEKEVSPIRIYLSLAITTVSVIAAIVILYSGIRNSVISIGRNPMSKKTVLRALIEIILTSVLILIIGLFAVYLLLKL